VAVEEVVFDKEVDELLHRQIKQLAVPNFQFGILVSVQTIVFYG